jgi:hypothetical protein
VVEDGDEAAWVLAVRGLRPGIIDESARSGFMVPDDWDMIASVDREGVVVLLVEEDGSVRACEGGDSGHPLL